MSISSEILRMMEDVEATPHQVVLKKDKSSVVLASGSVIKNKYGWGVETVTVEDDGNFTFQKNGPNISWVLEKFGKLRKNSVIGLANGSVVSCEPIKR
jgi:hypothetical protein